MATVAEILREAERALEAAGIETANLDAELLLRHVSGWDRAAVFSRSRETIDLSMSAPFAELVEKRVRRIPLQYLTGRQAFWRHEFKVSRAVLIPRPETEILVEAALQCLKDVATPSVIDVGTGSGCIAVSIAFERRDAHVLGIDVSTAALAVAAENAAAVGIADRMEWRAGTLLRPAQGWRGAVDLVASNPPYVDMSERLSLSPEVRYEPAAALFPLGDRYSLYRRLAPEAYASVRPGGWLVLEVGAGMADEVSQICTEAGFTVDRVMPDLQGIPRTVVAQR